MRNITIALIVVIGVLGGFYSGFKYSQSKVQATGSPVASTQTTGNGGGFGSGGGGGLFAGGSGASGPSGAGGARGGGGGAFGGGTSGQVVSFANGVLTLKERNGSTVKVAVTGQTPILKTTDGSGSDLTPGTTVTVIGTTGSDGTVDARAVTIGSPRAGAGG